MATTSRTNSVGGSATPTTVHDQDGTMNPTITREKGIDTTTFTPPSDDPQAEELDESARLHKYRKLALLVLFCVANFLEAVQLSCLFPTIPAIASQLHMIEQESVWLLSAYQLTFAAFLLMSGRLSDIYNPSESSCRSYCIIFNHLLM